MTTMRIAQIPTRPASQWPVSIRLRFKPDATVETKHERLRGTPVIVLSELRLIGPSTTDGNYSWRQQILSMGGSARVGWARPDQLELPVDELDD